MFEKRYLNELRHQKNTGLYRNPPEIAGKSGVNLTIGNRSFINFASNDYLGLAADPKVRKRVAKNFEALGSSSSSSRLVSGNESVIRDAERFFARHFGFEDALFFPSGFQANLALISTLFGKGDSIVFDKHIHASSVKGLSLSAASYSGFKHNNMSHLEKRLKKNSDRPTAVLTEGLFSMDGDFADVESLAALKETYGFLCVVDEAHSYGTCGDKGRGVAGNLADVGVGAMGKAFGLFGAFLLLPSVFRDYMLNFSAPLIYSTALPAAHARSAADILSIIEDSDDKRQHLSSLSKQLTRMLKEKGLTVKGDAHILSVEIGDENKTLDLAGKLHEEGLYIFPARFPTVPLGHAILRISLTANHKEHHIFRLAETLTGLL